MITVTGFVRHRNAESAGESSLRHFELQTTVYDPSNPSKSTDFSIFCFFPNGKRWKNTLVPNVGSCISITAKVMGRVAKKNCLAVGMLDMSYLSLPSTASPKSTQSTQSAQSTPTKRANRWSQRVDSTTPKKIRTSMSEEDPITPSSPSNSAPQAHKPELNLHSPATIPGDASPNIQSPITEIDLTEVQPLSLDGRPQRNRRPTAKMMD